VKPLLDLTTTHVAHLIVEARTPEGIRKRFNIKNDLTAEDLKKVCVHYDHFYCAVHILQKERYCYHKLECKVLLIAT